MAANPSIRAFKCPSCGGPLEPATGTLTMKCPYCGSSVIIPESLRTPPPSSGPSMGDVFNFGLQGVDLNKVVGNAMQLPKAIDLAKQGRIDEAANIYSQITGMDHQDAVTAVQSLAAGHAVSLTPGSGTTWQQYQASYSQPVLRGSSAPESSETITTNSGARGCGAIVGLLAAIAVIIVGLGAAAFFMFSDSKSSSSSLVPLPAVARTWSFGSEGIGQGMFQDPRSIGVDSNGNITVADYSDGRIQTFDPEGKFTSGFSISANNKDVYITGMGVTRDGTIYVSHDRKIEVFDPSGKKINEFTTENGYDSVAIGGDGKIYAIKDQESIVRLNPDGTSDLEVPDTFTNVAGDMDIDTHVAADGLGDMYIVGTFHYLVLKYSPDGKYVDQFGRQAKGDALTEPGKFTSPQSIATDGYGRVYVSDFFGIQVFDADGSFVRQIPVSDGVAFGMAFDDQNHLFVATNKNKVLRFDVQPPVNN